jgi:hypothetical protein
MFLLLTTLWLVEAVVGALMAAAVLVLVDLEQVQDLLLLVVLLTQLQLVLAEQHKQVLLMVVMAAILPLAPLHLMVAGAALDKEVTV